VNLKHGEGIIGSDVAWGRNEGSLYHACSTASETHYLDRTHGSHGNATIIFSAHFVGYQTFETFELNEPSPTVIGKWQDYYAGGEPYQFVDISVVAEALATLPFAREDNFELNYEQRKAMWHWAIVEMGGWNVGKHNQSGHGVTHITLKAAMEDKFQELEGAVNVQFWQNQLKRARHAWVSPGT